MKEYRVILQGGRCEVQLGHHTICFYYGDAPISWTSLGLFFTLEEANRFIEFHKKSTAGSYYLQRGAI